MEYLREMAENGKLKTKLGAINSVFHDANRFRWPVANYQCDTGQRKRLASRIRKRALQYAFSFPAQF